MPYKLISSIDTKVYMHITTKVKKLLKLQYFFLFNDKQKQLWAGVQGPSSAPNLI